ncbi:hypothetical protein ACVWWJ_001778 [Luteibacter sp. HA06]|jgi:hypothetical protein
MSNDIVDLQEPTSAEWTHAVILAATQREAMSTQKAVAELLASLTEHHRQMAVTLQRIRALPDASVLMRFTPGTETNMASAAGTSESGDGGAAASSVITG